MMTEIEVRTERVDDVPLLVHQQRRMGIPEVLDEVVCPHGNRQGLSLGELTCFWVGFILTEADHRMEQVEGWAADQRETLSALSLQPLGEKEFTDDRLADILEALGQDHLWEEVETRLGQRLVRVYHLREGPIRLDSTSVAVYRQAQKGTLFRYGHSQDHRPDLAQFKAMLASLDPLGMPLATLVVPGDTADDPLYEPAITRARQVVGQGERLYIGDSKMAALQTRAFLHTGGDHYLTSLPRTGEVPGVLTHLLEPVWGRQRSLERIYTPAEGEVRPKLLSLGYETTRPQQAEREGQVVTWPERVLVIFSPSLAQQQRRGLEHRLQRAQAEVLALTPPPGKGRRPWRQMEPLQQAVQSILKKHRVEGLLEVSYGGETRPRSVRRYGQWPQRNEEHVRYVVLQVQHREEAIRALRREMGWRLYVTNAPQDRLPLAKAVRAYRGAPLIERDFRRLKDRPLGIHPLYVQREDHVKGMVRLLSLALRVLTVTEYLVREKLKQAQEALTGLYRGLPKRGTVRPTAERLLGAFKPMTLTVVHWHGQTLRHITALTNLQQRILDLLDLPASIYEDLALHKIPNPP
jgi:transposase